MQEVKPLYDFLTPPATRIEDRAQPMGPLEQGDQALVDAVDRVPEGEHVAVHDGTRTRVLKDQSLGQDIVIAQTTTPDGSTKEASAHINSIPAISGIAADTAEWPAGQRGGRGTSHARNNEVQVGDTVFDTAPDREKAQAIKLEVAGKIDEARKHLGETGLEAAQR